MECSDVAAGTWWIGQFAIYVKSVAVTIVQQVPQSTVKNQASPVTCASGVGCGNTIRMFVEITFQRQ